MKKHQELIEKFHEKAKNQLIKEYQKCGTINSKIILLLLNHEDKPFYIYKRLPNIFLGGYPVNENYIQARTELRKMFQEVEEDGFNLLSFFRVHFDEPDSLYTFLKRGKDVHEGDHYRYNLIIGSTFVLPDGSFEREKPKLELVQING